MPQVETLTVAPITHEPKLQVSIPEDAPIIQRNRRFRSGMEQISTQGMVMLEHPEDPRLLIQRDLTTNILTAPDGKILSRSGSFQDTEYETAQVNAKELERGYVGRKVAQIAVAIAGGVLSYLGVGDFAAMAQVTPVGDIIKSISVDQFYEPIVDMLFAVGGMVALVDALLYQPFVDRAHQRLEAFRRLAEKNDYDPGPGSTPTNPYPKRYLFHRLGLVPEVAFLPEEEPFPDEEDFPNEGVHGKLSYPDYRRYDIG